MAFQFLKAPKDSHVVTGVARHIKAKAYNQKKIEKTQFYSQFSMGEANRKQDHD